MKPRVIIRTDGNGDIGLGHLTRCIALANMLSNEFDIFFMCMHIPLKLEQEILGFGFQIRRIRFEDEFFRFIQGGDIGVLDGYNFDTTYQAKIKQNGNLLVVIDDLHDKEYLADLIINHAPSVSSSDFIAQSYTQFALGIDFALLRPSFLAAARNPKQKMNMDNILICFGGADPKNLTQQVFTEVVESNRFKMITVVTGCTYVFAESLATEMSKYANVKHYSCIDEKEMIQVIQDAGVAVVPASGILLEVLAVGCKTISGIYTENQKFIYQQFLDRSWFADAKDFSRSNVKNALDGVFENSEQKMKPIDGLSGVRILRLFKALFAKSIATLRRATLADIDNTFRWATNPSVRAFSFNKHTITKDEHELWFRSKMNDENCFFYIFMIGQDEAGSIRFDVREKSAVISYLLDPKYQAQGLGSVLLETGESHFKSAIKNKNLQVNSIVGYVEKSNIASMKVFEKLSYIKSDESDLVKFENKIRI